MCEHNDLQNIDKAINFTYAGPSRWLSVVDDYNTLVLSQEPCGDVMAGNVLETYRVWVLNLKCICWKDGFMISTMLIN